jgi:hypothetical protein
MVSEGANESEPKGLEPDTPVPAPPAPAPGPAPKSSPWPEVQAVGTLFYEWLSRPSVRLTVTGVTLLLIGGLMMANSVWTLPLVIVGAVMVAIAWIGRRLDGRFAVEWGTTGTQLEFRAKITAPQRAQPTPTLTSSSSQALVRAPQLESDDPEVLDGEAHTVEIDVAELKALIAAAETAEAETAPADIAPEAATTTRNLRVAQNVL